MNLCKFVKFKKKKEGEITKISSYLSKNTSPEKSGEKTRVGEGYMRGSFYGGHFWRGKLFSK